MTHHPNQAICAKDSKDIINKLPCGSDDPIFQHVKKQKQVAYAGIQTQSMKARGRPCQSGQQQRQFFVQQCSLSSTVTLPYYVLC